MKRMQAKRVGRCEVTGLDQWVMVEVEACTHGRTVGHWVTDPVFGDTFWCSP